MLVSRREPVNGAYPLGTSCTATASPSDGTYGELNAAGTNVDMVAGVVPEGVSTVQVTLSSGKTETIPVTDDAWSLETEAHVQSVNDIVGG